MNASRYLRRLRRLGWVGRGLLWAVFALACPAWAGWEAGDFQTLPTVSVTDLALFVADARHMPHPTHGYTVPKRARADSFNALLDAVFSAIDTMLAGYPHGAHPWCDVVQHQAPRAHYAILRLWEQMSHRYFIYLRDTSTAGPQEAYVIINPEPTRNLLIEVPHARDSHDLKTYENYTAQEGAQLFKELGARALLMNGATRCASPTPSRCTRGTTTQCSADGSSPRVTVADAAHNTTTFFYLANQGFNRKYPTIKIVQLHGKADGVAQAIAGDSTTVKVNTDAVSVVFAQALAQFLGQRVDACQAKGQPEVDLCGTQNAEGRLVNNPGGNACTQAAVHASGRFLHIEQNRGLGTAHPDQVGAAIRDTWWSPTSCDRSNSLGTCDLSPPMQTQTADVPCR